MITCVMAILDETPRALTIPEGNCEAFGINCVCVNTKRNLRSIQRCNTCLKVFDLACKKSYAQDCEKEGECGCCEAPSGGEPEADGQAPHFNVSCANDMVPSKFLFVSFFSKFSNIPQSMDTTKKRRKSKRQAQQPQRRAVFNVQVEYNVH